MLSSYAVVKIFAKEHPEWLDVVHACYNQAEETQEFAGAWVCRRLGRWFPSLRVLARYGILEKVDIARGGRRAYYRMSDRKGVGKALQELGIPVEPHKIDIKRDNLGTVNGPAQVKPQGMTIDQSPTQAELARRQALIAQILAKRQQRVIGPLTSVDLVRKARREARTSQASTR